MWTKTKTIVLATLTVSAGATLAVTGSVGVASVDIERSAYAFSPIVDQNQESSNCTCNGHTISSGSVCCVNGKEFVCREGALHSTGNSCNVAPEGANVTELAGLRECVHLGIKPGSLNLLLTNSCDECVSVTYSWSDDQHEVVQVPASGSAVIKNRMVGGGYISAVQRCK